MYLFGYEELNKANGERIELYDLENDPDELNNIYSEKPQIAKQLSNELKSKLLEMNKPYL